MHLKHLLSLFFGLLIFFPQPPLYAQHHHHQGCAHTLRGKVEKQHENEELLGASVWIDELKTGVATDENGNFELHGICEGTYTIQCSHIGCKPQSVQIKIDHTTSPGQLVINFDLEQDEKILEEVQIRQRKPATDLNTQAVSELTLTELQKTRGQSLGESLTRITGISTIQTGGSIAKPVIQGMYGNRILLLNNGVRQEGQQWGAEHAPEIDPFIASRMTVIKGASGVRYGADAIGGVVMVIPKSLADNERLGGEINLSGASNGRKGVASATLEGKTGKTQRLAWRLQGTLQQSGNLRTPDYYLKNTGSKEANFSAALGYLRQKAGIEVFVSQFNTKPGIFSGAHVSSIPDLEVAMASPEPLEKAGFTYRIARPYQDVQHNLLKIKGYLKPTRLGTLHAVYSRQFNYRAEYDKHRPRNDSLAALDRPELRYQLTTHQAEITLDHKNVRNFYGTAGISAMSQSNTYNGRLFIPNFRTRSGGIFLIEHWERKKLHLEAGLRYDYRWMQAFFWQDNVIVSPQYHFSSLSATVGGKYNFNDALSVSANIASAWRAPSINEMFSSGLHQGIGALEFGNRNLRAERAWNFSATLNYESERVKTEWTLYTKLISDYIYLAPDSLPRLTIRGAFPVFNYRQADAIFKGVDGDVTVKLTSRLSYQGKVSLIRAFNRSVQDYLVWIPSDRGENALGYELDKWKKIKDLYLTVSVASVARQRRVPEKSDYKVPPKGYHLLNFEAGFTFHAGPQPLSLGFAVRNVLNTSYRDYMNRFRYFADEMGRNVTVRLKVPLELIK